MNGPRFICVFKLLLTLIKKSVECLLAVVYINTTLRDFRRRKVASSTAPLLRLAVELYRADIKKYGKWSLERP